MILSASVRRMLANHCYMSRTGFSIRYDEYRQVWYLDCYDYGVVITGSSATDVARKAEALGFKLTPHGYTLTE